jgi:hypothetical protein
VERVERTWKGVWKAPRKGSSELIHSDDEWLEGAKERVLMVPGLSINILPPTCTSQYLSSYQ